MKKVTIVGAGFSGLTLARALLQRKIAVEILEASSRVGGLIETRHTPFGLVERAAPSITRTDRLDRWVSELGLTPVTPSRASKKRLFFWAKPTAWPLGIWDSIRLGVRFLFSKVTGRLKPRPFETIQSWGERCLTKTSTDRLLATGLQGIYAGDAQQMSATLVLGPMFRKNRDRFRGVMGFQGGMQSLIEALETDIRARGGEIKLEAECHELPAGPVVLAVPPRVAAELLAPRVPLASSWIKKIHQAGLVTATAFFPSPTGPKAFGCLIPRGQGLRTLGVLLNHAIFPDRGEPAFSETWILGGATDPSVMELSDQDIQTVIRQERARIFNREDEPLQVIVTKWPEGLPHYDLTLEEVLAQDLEVPGLWLHGNWRGSIGLSRILERSEALADQIAKELL